MQFWEKGLVVKGETCYYAITGKGMYNVMATVNSLKIKRASQFKYMTMHV